jgi:aerobic-type carbon monoxide dehydrogenase small subunit (CoxS/CutS family)
MSMTSLQVNGKQLEVAVESDVPLLWALRENLGLKGTKYGCGIGVCGICVVLVNGEARRSCVIPVSELEGRMITTIEGLARDTDHPVIRAWIAEQVPQCGYCQPGQVMTAVALLQENPSPSDAQIDAALSGVLCRCGTYQRIRRAVHRAAALIQEEGSRE